MSQTILSIFLVAVIVTASALPVRTCGPNVVGRCPGPQIHRAPTARAAYSGLIASVGGPGSQIAGLAMPSGLWPPAAPSPARAADPTSVRVLSERVAELRQVYLPPDPAGRTTYLPGEIAQCDFWFPPVTLPVGFGQSRGPTQLPVLTMVTG